MAGLMDLIAGLTGAGGAAQSTQPPSDNYVDPVLLAPPQPTMASDAPPTPPPPPKTPSRHGYGNLPEVQAASQSYAENNPQSVNPISNFMGNHGTLRTLLGTLGDAFLVQAGHQPLYQTNNNNAIQGRALAGLDTDPGAAATRVAATGTPGGTEIARELQNQAATQTLAKSQAEFNNDWKTQQLDRQNRLAESTITKNGQTVEDKAKAKMGAAYLAAKTKGTPEAWAAAQAMAKDLGSKYIKDFNPALDIPDTPDQLNEGFGLTEAQLARIQHQNAALTEKTQNDQTMHGDRQDSIHRRPPTSTQYLKSLIDKQKTGAPLSQQESDYVTTHTTRPAPKGPAGLGGAHPVLPPAVANKPPPAAGGGQFSAYAADGKGGRVGYNGKQWVPVK